MLSDMTKRPNVLANGRFQRKWTRSLLRDDELTLLGKIEKRDWAIPFSEIADPDIGMVTGANNYFVVDIETAESYGLLEIASPMLARSKFITGITYTQADQRRNLDEGKRVLFIRFPDVSRSELPPGMVSYIALGESQGLHQRYKCRIRDPWYTVPYVWVSDIALLKRCHNYPRLVLNEAGALSTDTAYRITLRKEWVGRERDLVFSFLNSLTLLCAELEGRHYGGGVLELVPSEIENLLIPPFSADGSHFGTVDQMVREQRPLREILEYTDPVILGPGSPANLNLSQIGVLRQARDRLASRRIRVS